MLFLVMMVSSASVGTVGAMLTIFNGVFLIDGALMMGRLRGMGRFLMGSGGFGSMGSLGSTGRLRSTSCFRLQMCIKIK